MSLEKQLKQRRRVIRRDFPAEALEEVERGNKFIVVEDDFDPGGVPQGYTLIDMKHKGSSFKALVPQSLLFFMANPGEGNPESALEEIADFYGEAEDFEDDMIENGQTNVQETNWATSAKDTYQTYLINILVKGKLWGKDEEGEPVPELDPKTLEKLDLNDDYVEQRVKAIAALALGKTAEEIKQYDIRDVLKHVTVSWQELDKVRVKCHAGSHYVYKTQYKNVTKTREYSAFDSRIGDLEEQIQTHREQKHDELGRHDSALIRQYINLRHIAKENPRAQLDIMPPKKAKEAKEEKND